MTLPGGKDTHSRDTADAGPAQTPANQSRILATGATTLAPTRNRPSGGQMLGVRRFDPWTEMSAL